MKIEMRDYSDYLNLQMVEFCDREGAEPEKPNIFIGFSKI